MDDWFWHKFVGGVLVLMAYAALAIIAAAVIGTLIRIVLVFAGLQ